MYRSKIGEVSYTYKNNKVSSKRTYLPKEVTRALNISKGDVLIWEKVKEGFLITKEDGIKENKEE